MTSESVVGFADEMRVGLRGMVRSVWARRGVKVIQPMQIEYSYKYPFLVVDGRRGKLLWTWMDSMKSEEVASSVRRLRHNTDVSALVWDGARSHRGEKVEGFGVTAVIQPPYSPALHPAERMFEEVRRWVEGIVYLTIEDKVAAVEVRLRELKSDPARAHFLAWWARIDDNVSRLDTAIAA